MSPCRRCNIGGGNVANVVICTGTSVNHFIVYCNTPTIIVILRDREDARFQTKPEVVVTGPKLGVGGQWIQQMGRG